MTIDDIIQLAQQPTRGKRYILEDFNIANADTDIIAAEALPQIGFQLGTHMGQSYRDQNEGIDTFSTHDHNWGIQFKTPVYSFGRLGDVLQLYKMRKRINKVKKNFDDESYFKNIIQLYTIALLAKNHSIVADKSVKYARSLFNFTKIEYENGGRSKIDFFRTQSNLSSTLANLEKTASHALSAEMRLKNALGLKLSDPFELLGGEPENTWFLSIPDKLDTKQKTQKQELTELNRDLYHKLAEYRYAQHYPTIYLTAQAGSQAGKPNKLGGPESEISDIFEPKRTQYSVGLVLEWQLFSGFQTSSIASKARSEAIKAELDLQQMYEEEDIQKLEAASEWKSAANILKASREARRAMTLAFEQAKGDYEVGVINLTNLLEVQRDLHESEKSVFEAYANQIQTAAKVRVQYRFGLTQ